MLLLTLIVNLNYFRRKPLSSGSYENSKGLVTFTALLLHSCSGSWWVKICCVTNFLCFFTLEIESILVYILFICSYLIKHFYGQFRRHLSRYYRYGAFIFLLLLLLLIVPIDSKTWYTRIGVFYVQQNEDQIFHDLIFLDVGTAKDKF